MIEVAVAVKNGGHFDKIMGMIDEMIAALRKEEAEDIAHRDRCQGAQGKNGNDMDDLDHDIAKAGEELERMGDKETELKATIKSLEEEITTSKTSLEELLSMRNAKNEAPKYSVDEDKAPEADFSAGNKRGQETGGIIAILEMVKEDTENEIKTSREEDAEAGADYEKSRGALQETLDAQTASKVANEQELAELQEDIADTEELKDSKASDLAEEQPLEASLKKVCAWVESHCDARG